MTLTYDSVYLHHTFKTMTGEELKTLRLKAGLTQTELAEKIKVAYNRISEWENGKYKMSKVYNRLLNEVFKELFK